ncbi:hypothetical protein FM109_11885 [Vibrio casei]|nr:hypothetical protein FM109_11885 [Vibrio casei]
MSLEISTASGNITLIIPLLKARLEPSFIPTNSSVEPSIAMKVAAAGLGRVMIRLGGASNLISCPVTSVKLNSCADKLPDNKVVATSTAKQRDIEVITPPIENEIDYNFD